MHMRFWTQICLRATQAHFVITSLLRVYETDSTPKLLGSLSFVKSFNDLISGDDFVC